MTSLDGNLPSSSYTPGEIFYFYLVMEARVSKLYRLTHTPSNVLMKFHEGIETILLLRGFVCNFIPGTGIFGFCDYLIQ